MNPPRDPALPDDLRGLWVAWDDNRRHVLAVAADYPALLQRIAQLGLPDPIIERAPGCRPADPPRLPVLLEGESPDILHDIRATLPDAETWLDTPNTRLGFRKPRDLVGTPREQHLRDLLRGLWNGITS